MKDYIEMNEESLGDIFDIYGYTEEELQELHYRSIRNEAREEGLAEGRTEGRAEGLEEGFVKGVDKGRSEGRVEGLTKGRVEGRTEGKTEDAYNLKKLGVPLDIIIKATGLTEAEVLAL